MTDLRQCLHDSLDTQHTDLMALAQRARAQGSRQRRRRRVASVTGSILMTTILALGVLATLRLVPGAPAAQRTAGFAAPGVDTVRASGETVTAALYAAVDDVADGSVDRIRGGMLAPVRDDATGETAAERVNASFALTLSGASGPGEVSLSIGHRVSDNRLWTTLAALECPPGAIGCRHKILPDGSRLTTYRTQGTSPDGDPAGVETTYAERLVDDVIVTVWAANGLRSPNMRGSRLPHQPSAVLSVEQLSQVVSLPWWGVELPASVAETPLPSDFELLPGGAGSL